MLLYTGQWFSSVHNSCHTEILANQHYETIKELLFGMVLSIIKLLTVNLSKERRRKAILTGLLTGDVKIF